MQPKRSGLAVASFTLGIVAFVLGWSGKFGLALVALPLSALAVVLGGVALGLARRGRMPGRGIRLAGSGAALGVLAIVLAFGAMARNVRQQFEPTRWDRGGVREAPPRMARNTGTGRVGKPLTNFQSRLPVVVLHTEGQWVGKDASTVVHAEFYPPGRTAGFDPSQAEHSGLAAIHMRGNSSLHLPKSSFTLHTLDAKTNQVKVPLLGLPKEEDWVLYASYEDKTMLRDVLAFELTRQMGHYAPRTRFVELFMVTSSGPVSVRDYEGVYVLVEKIKRGPERVNIAKLGPDDRTEPAITGGYILKRDHHEDDGRRFNTRHSGPYFHVYPNDRAITAEQRAWIGRYLNDFETALYGPDFANPETGYAPYLDVASFIDAHWLIELSKNIDGFRFSSFLTKDRGGKLRTEPPWDWNRAFGNANYYDGWETDGWYWPKLRVNEISWYRRLREDPAFVAKAQQRWRKLRATVFDPVAINAKIDELAAELDGPQQRNFKRWPILGRQVTCNYYVGDTYQDEVKWLKDWITHRVAWIDRRIGRGSAEASGE